MLNWEFFLLFKLLFLLSLLLLLIFVEKVPNKFSFKKLSFKLIKFFMFKEYEFLIVNNFSNFSIVNVFFVFLKISFKLVKFVLKSFVKFSKHFILIF